MCTQAPQNFGSTGTRRCQSRVLRKTIKGTVTSPGSMNSPRICDGGTHHCRRRRGLQRAVRGVDEGDPNASGLALTTRPTDGEAGGTLAALLLNPECAEFPMSHKVTKFATRRRNHTKSTQARQIHTQHNTTQSSETACSTTVNSRLLMFITSATTQRSRTFTSHLRCIKSL